jgi:hypothetical protein
MAVVDQRGVRQGVGWGKIDTISLGEVEIPDLAACSAGCRVETERVSALAANREVAAS